MTSRLFAAVLCFVALGFGASPIHAGGPTAGQAAARKPMLPSGKQLDAKIAGHLQTAQSAMDQHRALYSKAAATGDQGLMQQAVGLRATALRAKLDALRTEAFREERSHQKGSSANARALRQQAEAVRTELRDVRAGAPQIAQQEVAAVQTELRAAEPKLSWKDARQAFQTGMQLKDFAKAGEALKQMESAVGGGLMGRFRQFQLGRDKQALLKANRQLAKTMLTDTLNGRLDFATVRRSVNQMEREAQQGNFIARMYKGAKLALTKRHIRQTIERKMIHAVRDGSVAQTGDADLLKALKDGTLRAQIDQGWQEQAKPFIDEANRVVSSAVQGGMDPQGPELAALQQQLNGEFGAFRKQYNANVRAGLHQSAFIEGLRTLNFLDKKAQRSYSESKGVRGFVNGQVHRFSSWVLGSPLRSRDKAERELIKQADFLSKKQGKDVNAHLQAHALLLTAKQLKVGETKAFEKTREKAIKRVQTSIAAAVKSGDPDAVRQGYGLYEAYGMDHKGREWGGPKTTINYQKDLTTAQRTLVTRLSHLARELVLHPKQAAVAGAHPGMALELNALADALAQRFTTEMPGAIPQKLWNQINANKDLIDGRGAKAKLTKFWHSGWNVAAWPWRLGKFILSQPMHLVRPHAMPKAAKELQEMWPVVQKYMQQPQAAMAGAEAQQAHGFVPPPPAGVVAQPPSAGGGGGEIVAGGAAQ